MNYSADVKSDECVCVSPFNLLDALLYLSLV